MSELDLKRKSFFKIVLGEDSSGYLCISRRTPGTRQFEERFFHYPDQLDSAVDWLALSNMSHDLYFCPQLLTHPKRVKTNVQDVTALWADLDTCPPEELLVEPTIAVETSPGRWQALWCLSEPLEGDIAEQWCKRIAYFHQESGADTSGWDLTQLLRVPFGFNHKYTQANGMFPQVLIRRTGERNQPLTDFDGYPELEDQDFLDIPFPTDATILAMSADDVLQEHSRYLKPAVWTLYNETPQQDWSKALWQLELLLSEAGLTREEVFIVCREAKCNKYERDHRNQRYLWREVCKATAFIDRKTVTSNPQGVARRASLTPLLSEQERREVVETPTIVEEYIDWAKSLGDAAWQYHQAGGFVILSSLLSGSVRLPTSYGMLIPNLWFLILADSTLTRKTTAMDVAMELLTEIDSNVILATDGSIEGLMTSLAMRPGKPSVFLRDEFTGLLEQMSKKDYLAGMAETLTKLYDGKYQKRILRKEVLELRDPCLVFFAGGIRTKLLGLISDEHVFSGFMPRFCVVMAHADIRSMLPLGPPTQQSDERRRQIRDKFEAIYKRHTTDQTITVEGRSVTMPKKWGAELTSEAWSFYNQMEATMMNDAITSEAEMLLAPTFDRLCKSGLKAAVLLATARNTRDDKVIVERHDLLHSFYYVEQWREFAMEMLHTAGTTTEERKLQKLLEYIIKHPGTQRSTLMQYFRLNAREADGIFTTLEQRGHINRVRKGRGEYLYPAE